MQCPSSEVVQLPEPMVKVGGADGPLDSPPPHTIAARSAGSRSMGPYGPNADRRVGVMQLYNALHSAWPQQSFSWMASSTIFPSRMVRWGDSPLCKARASSSAATLASACTPSSTDCCTEVNTATHSAEEAQAWHSVVHAAASVHISAVSARCARVASSPIVVSQRTRKRTIATQIDTPNSNGRGPIPASGDRAAAGCGLLRTGRGQVSQLGRLAGQAAAASGLPSSASSRSVLQQLA